MSLKQPGPAHIAEEASATGSSVPASRVRLSHGESDQHREPLDQGHPVVLTGDVPQAAGHAGAGGVGGGALGVAGHDASAAAAAFAAAADGKRTQAKTLRRLLEGDPDVGLHFAFLSRHQSPLST